MIPLVIFPTVRAFALRENVFTWTNHVDNHFVLSYGMTIKEFLRMAADDAVGRITPVYLLRPSLDSLNTMLLMRTAQIMNVFLIADRRHNIVRCMRVVQRLWRARRRRLAVMMALHPRLGAGSALFQLDADVLRMFV